MSNPLDPGQWFIGAERLIDKAGVVGTVAIILAIGAAIGFALRGPGIISGLKQIVDTILTHRRESRRISERIERENRKLATDLDKKIAKATSKAEVKSVRRA